MGAGRMWWGVKEEEEVGVLDAAGSGGLEQGADESKAVRNSCRPYHHSTIIIMPPIPLAHPIPLFAAHPPPSSTAVSWRTALPTFKSVDDRVRGGSSTSHTSLTPDGSLLFSGFLDTTTLGGAGFASQRYEEGFPTYLDSKVYSGLEVRVRQPASSMGVGVEKVPGGGQHAVTSYVLNLYTSMPTKRPDGRNESSTTYEYVIDLSSPSSSSSLVSLDPTWQDFKPFYRGRPQPSAPPLQPEQVKMWSIMARSDFAQQSGEFELVVDSIWATPKGGRGGRAQLAKREKGDGHDEWLRPAKLHGARGFALYAFATVLLVAWTAWALLPQAWLERCGVDWYPSR